MALKKSAQNKPASKKAITKKTASKKTVSGKAKTKKVARAKDMSKKAARKKIIPQITFDDMPISGDCACKQKRPNGKYFSFRLVQGRWVQSSGVPFPTKELCEEVNC